MAPPHAPGTHEARPSQALTPVKETMEVLNNSDEEDTKEEEVDEKELVSFNDVMEAADHAVDAFESSMLSRVSTTNHRDMHAT